MSYLEEARNDARQCAREFTDTILSALADVGEASDDLPNDYPNGDAYHHESHVDKEYSLSEADDLLSELSDYEEDDSGLWQGLPPRQAISAQAAYTYGNAVYSQWRRLIRAINDEHDDEKSDLGFWVRSMTKWAGFAGHRAEQDLREGLADLPGEFRENATRFLGAPVWTAAECMVMADLLEEGGQPDMARKARDEGRRIDARERAEQALTEFIKGWN